MSTTESITFVLVVSVLALSVIGLLIYYASRPEIVEVDLRPVPMSCEEAQTQRMICLETIDKTRRRSEFAKCWYVTDKYC